jgi:hypothetical protein
MSNVIGVKAWIDISQLRQGSDQKSRACEQHSRKRDLKNDLHGRVAVEDVERMSEQHWSIVAKMAHSPIPDEAVRAQTIRRIRELGAPASELLGV